MSHHGGSSPRLRGQSPPKPPSSRVSRGPPSSPTRSPAGSATGSAPVNPFQKGLGFDPARSVTEGNVPASNRRLELPPEAYMVEPLDRQFARRPGYNENGKKISVELNHYAVVKRKDNFRVYQYDVR